MNPDNARRRTAWLLGLTMASASLPAWAFDVIAPLPEPGTMALVLGAAGVAVLVWRNRRK